MLIATTPAHGHVSPVRPIAARLAGNGHDVRWYTGQAYEAAVTAAGARFEPMRSAVDFGGKSKADAFPEHAGLTGLASFKAGMKDVFYRTAPGQLGDLLEILTDFPADVIVSDDMCYGAAFAAELREVPIAWVGNSVYLLNSRDTAPLGHGLGPSSSVLGRLRNRFLTFVGDHVVLRDVRRCADEVRASAGLPALRTSVMENIARRPALYLVGTAAPFEFPRSDLFEHTHFVGALDQPADDDFEPPAWWPELSGGRKVVLVTQGTVADDARRLLAPAIRALADLPVLVVVTTGNRSLDPALAQALPANARVEKFVPYHRLLPYVDVMVTNGGYNGVNAALAHGVPLVLAGATEEKADVAARVKWAGVGVALNGRSLSEAKIRRAVTTVLTSPRFRVRAEAMSEHYRRADGPRRAAELIEALTALTTTVAGGQP